MSDRDRTERVATSVNAELKKQIRIEAAKRGQSMSELVREILEDEFQSKPTPAE